MISIHAPRGGSDNGNYGRRGKGGDFNPRSPWGERRRFRRKQRCRICISIHAPRGGSDEVLGMIAAAYGGFQSTLPVGGATLFLRPIWYDMGNFNPRSPWGERHAAPINHNTVIRFQSTLPVGGATFCNMAGKTCTDNFNPRSPWGERPISVAMKTFRTSFQSTLPVGGATILQRLPGGTGGDFNPRSPWGERPRILCCLPFLF